MPRVCSVTRTRTTSGALVAARASAMSGSIEKGCRQQSCPVHPQSITKGGLDPWCRHPLICFPDCRRGASPCSTVSPLPPRCRFRLSHARPLLSPPTSLFTVNCWPSPTLQPQIVQLSSLDQPSAAAVPGERTLVFMDAR